MATLPTPEKFAQEILDIFVFHFNSRAGDVLRSNNFLAVWPQRGYVADDLYVGLEYAIKKGWIELPSSGNSFRLTESGFSAA